MVKANWWRPLPALGLLAVAAALSVTAGAPDALEGAVSLLRAELESETADMIGEE